MPHKFKNRKIMPYIAKTVSIKWAKYPNCHKYHNLALTSWWQTHQVKLSNHHRIIQWMKMLKWYNSRTCCWMWSKDKTFRMCYHMPKHINIRKYNPISTTRTIIKLLFNLMAQAITKALTTSSSKWLCNSCRCIRAQLRGRINTQQGISLLWMVHAEMWNLRMGSLVVRVNLKINVLMKPIWIS